MNTFVSISLIFLSLIRGMAPGMDLCCELQNLPDLVNVYQEHGKFESELFRDFLQKECSHDRKPIEEQHRDSQTEDLPIQGNNPCCNSFVFTPVEVPLPAETLCFITGPEYSFYRFTFSSVHPDTPFQPPRL